MLPKIKFYFENIDFKFSSHKPIKEHIKYIFYTEGTVLQSITLVFSNDEYLLQLNKQYRNHDYYTDILTFDLSGESKAKCGEIYISIERVRENARLLNEKFLTELYRVIFHGVLHLCGYRDNNKTTKKLMTYKEDFYLNKYHVSRETFS